MAELVFVSVLGLLSIFLVLGVLGAVSEARAGVGPRPEVLGFLAAVLLLLLLGGFAYTSLFGPTP